MRRKWIISLGGCGLSPIAPGTAGSLATAALLAGIAGVFHPGYLAWQCILLTGVLGFSALTVLLGRWAVANFGDDPQLMVLDEAAGICLTGLFLPIYPGQPWTMLVLVFAAFRLFDVTKPPPARQLESLPLGWGILLDDLAAGVYANLLCQVLLRFVLK